MSLPPARLKRPARFSLSGGEALPFCRLLMRGPFCPEARRGALDQAGGPSRPAEEGAKERAGFCLSRFGLACRIVFASLCLLSCLPPAAALPPSKEGRERAWKQQQNQALKQQPQKLASLQQQKPADGLALWQASQPGGGPAPKESAALPEHVPLPWDPWDARAKKPGVKKIRAAFSSLKKKHAASPATVWSLTYQEALLLKQKDAGAFCESMRLLSAEDRFPLHQLALISSYEICPYPGGLKLEPDLFPVWLQLRAAEALYKRKAKFNSPRLTFEAARHLGMRSPYKDLRISYLKHALFIAGKEGYEGETAALTKKLYQDAPRLKPNPAFSDYLAIADDFRKNRSFKMAARFYRKILNARQAGFHEKNSAFRWLAWIYKVQRNYKKRATAYRQWSRWLLSENTEESLTRYYNSRLKLARSHWNRSKNSQALEVLNSILEDPKSSVVRERVYWMRGLIRAEEGRLSGSLKDLDEAVLLLEGKKNQALLEKVLWKKAWLLRIQKRHKPSLAALARLEKETKNPYMRRKALFWKGETYRDLRHKFRAKRIFRKLKDEDLFGYYGLMARYRLGESLRASKGNIFPKQSLMDKTARQLVYWLSLFKEKELLSAFLKTKKKFFGAVRQKTAEDWLSLFSLYISAGHYLKVFQSMEEMEAPVKRYFFEAGLEWLFPLGFEREARAAAEDWGIEPALIFALIRQESAFQKRARSPADAFGLMQMISSTARQTARRIKAPYRGFRDLYIPSKSILLGTAHLKQLLDRYDNSFILAMAAYNAGETPVKKWRRAFPASNPLEFIESIPYRETRNYVRLLIRNYLFYHSILNEGLSRGQPLLPERILAISPPPPDSPSDFLGQTAAKDRQD